jgi:hypothetical protein
MQGTVTDLVGWAGKRYLPVLYFHSDITVDRLLQFSFRSFHSNNILFAY